MHCDFEFQLGMLMGGTNETARAQANRVFEFERDLAKIFVNGKVGSITLFSPRFLSFISRSKGSSALLVRCGCDPSEYDPFMLPGSLTCFQEDCAH